MRASALSGERAHCIMCRAPQLCETDSDFRPQLLFDPSPFEISNGPRVHVRRRFFTDELAHCIRQKADLLSTSSDWNAEIEQWFLEDIDGAGIQHGQTETDGMCDGAGSSQHSSLAVVLGGHDEGDMVHGEQFRSGFSAVRVKVADAEKESADDSQSTEIDHRCSHDNEVAKSQPLVEWEGTLAGGGRLIFVSDVRTADWTLMTPEEVRVSETVDFDHFRQRLSVTLFCVK